MTDNNAMPDEIWCGPRADYWSNEDIGNGDTRYIRPDAVKVKGLQWIDDLGYLYADTILFDYILELIQEGFWKVICKSNSTELEDLETFCESRDGAKAYAEAHYLATINSLLTNATATIGGE